MSRLADEALTAFLDDLNARQIPRAAALKR